MSSAKPHILIIEPFYGGSHKQLIGTLIEGRSCNTLLMSLTITPIRRSQRNWLWDIQPSRQEMALASTYFRSAFFPADTSRSRIPGAIYQLRTQPGRTDWRPSGSWNVPEDRILPRKPTDLSGAWGEAARLSIRFQWDPILVSH